MNPVDFPQANKALGPPSERGNCGGLKVWTDGEVCLSAWMPTEEERRRIAAGEPVWLWVHQGATQPPVALEVASPWNSDVMSGPDAAFLAQCGIAVPDAQIQTDGQPEA